MLLQKFQVICQLSSHSYSHHPWKGDGQKVLTQHSYWMSEWGMGPWSRWNQVMIYMSSPSALSNKFILDFTSYVFSYKQSLKAFCNLLVSSPQDVAPKPVVISTPTPTIVRPGSLPLHLGYDPLHPTLPSPTSVITQAPPSNRQLGWVKRAGRNSEAWMSFLCVKLFD